MMQVKTKTVSIKPFLIEKIRTLTHYIRVVEEMKYAAKKENKN
jgi:hypothetical protein